MWLIPLIELPLYIPRTDIKVDRCLRSIAKPTHFPCMSFPLTVGWGQRTLWEVEGSQLGVKCFSWLTCTLTIRELLLGDGGVFFFWGRIIDVGERKEREKQRRKRTKQMKGRAWMVQQTCSCSWFLGLEAHAAEASKKQIFLVLTVSTLQPWKHDIHTGGCGYVKTVRRRKSSLLEFSKPPAMTVELENRYITSSQFPVAVNLLWNHPFRKREVFTLQDSLNYWTRPIYDLPCVAAKKILPAGKLSI